MYGREDYTTTLLKKDGRIKSAVMDNFLLLKGKPGCDIDLNNCTATLPYAIRMQIHLLPELME